MANYNDLITAIDSVIKTNNRREITGQLLQNVLNTMVGSLGENYQLAGFATPTTNPHQPDQNVFYVASQAGVYTQFDNIVMGDGISFLMWKNGAWTSQTISNVTQSWVQQNFVSKEWFRKVFRVYDEDGLEIVPNDMDSVVDNIKAMVGLWTNEYLSALGMGRDGGGTTQALAQLNDVQLGTLENGDALVYNTAIHKWENKKIQTGVDMSVVWTALAANTNEQINASHLVTALSDYVTSANLSTILNDYATKTWAGQNFITVEWFDKLFQLYNGTEAEANKIAPNGALPVDQTNLNIEAMFGFWTKKYISALGQGDDGSTSYTTLAQLNDVTLTNPTANQILKYDGTHWVNATAPTTYVLPQATANALGGIKIGYNDATPKTYAVALNSAGQAYVAVPWENTTYTLAGLMGSTAIGGTTQPIYWNGSGFTTCTAYANASVSYATSAGSATSANTATKALYLLTNDTSQAADDCYDGAAGLRFWRYNGTSSTTGQTGGDGWILSWSWGVGSVGGQIYLDDNPSKTICIRGYNNTTKDFTTWATLLHSDNYTDYTVKKDGTGASGSWGISITGNAATATKLATSRTLWGQSFDGSGNVSGNMTGVGSITASGTIKSTYYGPAFSSEISSGWSYMKFLSNSYEWHIGTVDGTSSRIGQAGVFEIRSAGDNYSGISIRRSTSSYGKLVVTVPSGECSIGYRVGDSSANPQWVTGAVDGTNYGIYSTAIGSTIVTYKTNGNVGIGDPNPAYKLEVGGTSRIGGNLLLQSTNGTYIQIGAIQLVYDSTNNAIKVVKSDGTNANLYATGGLSALGAGQESGGGGDVTWALLANNNDNRQIAASHLTNALGGYLSKSGDTTDGRFIFSNEVPFFFTNSGSGTYTKGAFYCNQDGISVETPRQSDDSRGTMTGFRVLARGGQYAPLYCSSVIQQSDIRLKSRIKDTDLRIEQIANAPSFKYRWKDAKMDTDLHVGTSAQYWESVLPQVVTTAKDEMGTKALQYGVAALISTITVARKVMTHEEKIALLETRVSALEKENGEQEQLINSLQEELAKYKAA